MKRFVVLFFAIWSGIVFARPIATVPGFENSTKPLPTEQDGWPVAKFKANYKYPKQLQVPTGPWLSTNPTDPAQYRKLYQSILEYGLSAFSDDIQKGCPKVSPNWYHAPWMTRGASGREPLCGLTRERHVRPGMLYPDLQVDRQAWAVGMFNEIGGYQLGQIWKNRSKPDLTKLTLPNGSFIVKFLFADIRPDDGKPYSRLAGAPTWLAHVYDEDGVTQRRSREMRLIQIDFAVKTDQVAGQTGWVFGTFVYNNPDGNTKPWQENLIPIGHAWGNDYLSLDGSDMKEGHLTDEAKLLRSSGTLFDPARRTEFGWKDRVNGPIDNPASSCLSCHSTAQVRRSGKLMWQPITPAVSEEVTDAGERQRLTQLWFRNIKAGEPFKFSAADLSLLRNPPGDEKWTEESMNEFVSADYSLQIRMGLEMFFAERNALAKNNLQTKSTLFNLQRRIPRQGTE